LGADVHDIVGARQIVAYGGQLAPLAAFYGGVMNLSRLDIGGPPTAAHFACIAQVCATGQASVATVLSFFVAAIPARAGALVFGVRPGELACWAHHLRQRGVRVTGAAWAFGEEQLCFTDPEGGELALVEDQAFAPPVPRSAAQAVGLSVTRLRSIEVAVDDPAAKLRALLSQMGLSLRAQDGRLQRFDLSARASGPTLELLIDAPSLRVRRAPLNLMLEVGTPEGLEQLAACLDAAGFEIVRSSCFAQCVAVKLDEGEIKLCVGDGWRTSLT
jgi:hypothetical protein